jgi:hypothetical protein
MLAQIIINKLYFYKDKKTLIRVKGQGSNQW